MRALIEPTLSSPSRLPYRLSAALHLEARAVAERIGREAFEATTYLGAPLSYRRARIIALLAADALNDHRAPQARIVRWRRFLRALQAFLSIAHSRSLEELLLENADLL